MTDNLGRYKVVRRAFTYVVSDHGVNPATEPPRWIAEYRSRAKAHREADRLNREHRAQEARRNAKRS